MHNRREKMSGVSQCKCGCWVEFNSNGMKPETIVEDNEESTIEIVLNTKDEDGGYQIHFFEGVGIYFGVNDLSVIVYDGDDGLIGYFPKYGVISARNL